MEDNRNERCPVQSPPGAILTAETLRSSAQSSTAEPAAKGEERMPLFWRVFGGTVLSIIALAAVTVYQQFTSSLHEVRGDLGHLGTDLRKELGRLCETHAELVKKDEFSTRMRSVWDNMKELRADNTMVAALRERCTVLEQQMKAGEEERKELGRDLQRLREARAADDERKELIRELQGLRERLAAMEGRQTTTPTVKPAVHREN